MIDSGGILYILLAVIVYMFWRRSHGMSLEELLDRSGHEHELVRSVHERHPRGGPWREYRRWMAEQETHR
ncbi:MAG: hypothetical protein GWN84_26390 [Gammaproteobacteria bacterium]|nr:hypothetical protein [Gammaproteobacteria bacterium]NIR85928.1 hypothetical protein [Gammaproteobacteria bacterium]NIR91920.1 hypothetical protein [Gammaproteobacteria bacterium]NIU07177.1 hypothetical protein [Gammaproteobacteria bacterium]NIV53990.1 hypothetical protein [Gammaproteobacteria bacterium]